MEPSPTIRMRFTPDHYFQTALQRARQASRLHQHGLSYALAIYVGGVAVECLLRAFKSLHDPTFDEKHNLLLLLTASKILELDVGRLKAKNWSAAKIEGHRQDLKVAINEIYAIWQNGFRFASEERLRAYFKSLPRNRRIRGDCLKEQSRRFLNSVQRFINLGVIQWPN